MSGAFITGAATYGIDLDEMAAAALPNVPANVLKESTEFYAWTVKKKRSTFGLSRDTFIACDALKRSGATRTRRSLSYWGELKREGHRCDQQAGVRRSSPVV